MSKEKPVYRHTNSSTKDSIDKNSFYLVDKLYEKGYTYPLHWHPHYELELIVNGEIEYRFNTDTYIAKRGDTFLLSNIDYHSIKILRDARVITLAFIDDILHPELARYITTNLISTYHHFEEKEVFNLIDLAKQLRFEQEHPQKFSKIIAEGIVSKVVINLLRNSNELVNNENPLLIQSVISTIDRVFASNITIDTLANQLGITPYYLGKRFKDSMGISFNEYLNTRRLRYACDKLVSSNDTLTKIALDSGYHSVEYFLYVFKKHLSCTPTQYKKLASKENKIIL